MSVPPGAPPREVIEAFASAAITALSELTRIEAFHEPIAGPVAATLLGPIVSAAIRLERQVPGALCLVLTANAASQLAEHYLPRGAVLSDDLVDDVVGEFANVIAGQAKTSLKGTAYHFTLTTPIVSRAAFFAQLSSFADARCCTALATEFGRVVLMVDLPPCASA